jgi:hypothetical protein
LVFQPDALLSAPGTRTPRQPDVVGHGSANLPERNGNRSVGFIRLVFHTRKERFFDEQQNRAV